MFILTWEKKCYEKPYQVIKRQDHWGIFISWITFFCNVLILYNMNTDIFVIRKQ